MEKAKFEEGETAYYLGEGKYKQTKVLILKTNNPDFRWIKYFDNKKDCVAVCALRIITSLDEVLD